MTDVVEQTARTYAMHVRVLKRLPRNELEMLAAQMSLFIKSNGLDGELEEFLNGLDARVRTFLERNE